MKCKLCNAEINEKNSNNGYPLVEGRVCNDCNWKVIKERLRKSRESEKSAKEQVTSIGCGGPVSTVDPMADFEKYAKQFEETFILGDTPVRKEEPKNEVKINKGELVGEVDSLEKPQKAEQVEPEKSATESLKGFSQIWDFLAICKELGLNTLSDVEKFLKDNPGDPLESLRKYREGLGLDWYNLELTEKDSEELQDLWAKKYQAEEKERVKSL